MTPNLNPNSVAKILQIFCNPFLQTQNMKTSRGLTPKCYTFLETSHDPKFKSQHGCKILHIFSQPFFCNTSIDPIKTVPQILYLFEILTLTLFLIPVLLYPFPLPLAHNPLHTPFSLYLIPFT